MAQEVSPDCTWGHVCDALAAGCYWGWPKPLRVIGMIWQGMGEGEGAKDVSDQITDEDQLLGAQQRDQHADAPKVCHSWATPLSSFREPVTLSGRMDIQQGYFKSMEPTWAFA